MLRMESETGWWLITHPDHARLAGEFAAAWGNAQFRKPEPRARVLKGIARPRRRLGGTRCASVRDSPREAFGILDGAGGQIFGVRGDRPQEYLSVRGSAVRIVAGRGSLCRLLISMHTHNLLTAHADRSDDCAPRS